MMKRTGRIIKSLVCATLIAAMSLSLQAVPVLAENPLVQTTYTADPAPLVVGDTLYLYTTHDELRETMYDDWSYMNDWRLYSTKDMVNWTDHGQIAHAETFDKASGSRENWRAWAHQVVERPIQNEDGEWEIKYFLYAPFNGNKIDVAVSDSPEGPFVDATPGKFLLDGSTWDFIDPTVYIEDYGNPDDYENYDAYMYWGNPYVRYCKLTDDMVDVDPDTDGDGVLSAEESVIDPRFNSQDNKILGEVRPGLHSFQSHGDEGYASFGRPSQGADTKSKFPTEPDSASMPRSAFEEGPWLCKHEDGDPDTDDYFLFFVGGRTPGETAEYSTAPTPLGPWTYRALLMAREHGNSCIHPGIAEYKGKNYLFYLNDKLIGGTGSNRSVCVKEFEYDENNLVKRETPNNNSAYMTQLHGNEQYIKGEPFFSVDPVGTLDPYELNQAETICWESNLDGNTGGFNGTPAGVKTKAKEQCTDIDEVTGKEAFWKSSAYYGTVVYDIDNNDYIKLREVDFGEKGPIGFTASVACGEGLPPVNTTRDSNGMMFPNPDADTDGGDIEIWVDYEDEGARQLIGTVSVYDTGGTNTYEDYHIDIEEEVTGIHDLFFIFKGGQGVKLFNFDTWQFEKEPEPTPEPTSEPTAAPQGPQTPSTVNPTSDPAKSAPVTIGKPSIKKIKKGKNKVTLTLKKVVGAKGYQIFVSNKKSGKYTKKLTVKKTKAVLKKLKTKKKYFVKVKAFGPGADGKTIYSKFSAVKKFIL